MKHDIAAVARHKSKQCDEFSISTNVCDSQSWSLRYVCHVCDISMIMNVTISDDPVGMYVMFIRNCC